MARKKKEEGVVEDDGEEDAEVMEMEEEDAKEEGAFVTNNKKRPRTPSTKRNGSVGSKAKKKKKGNVDAQTAPRKRVKPNRDAVQPLESLEEFMASIPSPATSPAVGSLACLPRDAVVAIFRHFGSGKKMRVQEVCKAFWRCWWETRSHFSIRCGTSPCGNAELNIILNRRLAPSDLTTFIISNRNKKVNSALASLKRFHSMTQLDLSGCTEVVSSSLRPPLKSLKRLEYLNLSNTLIRDEDAILIQRLTRLTSLHLSNCPLLREGITFSSIVSQLLHLRDLGWEAPAPWDLDLVNEFNTISKLSQLERLSFSLPRPDHLTCLSSLRSLESLTLRGMAEVKMDHIRHWSFLGTSAAGGHLTELRILDSSSGEPERQVNDDNDDGGNDDADESIVTIIGQMDQLRNLSFERSPIVPQRHLPYLSHLTALVTLNLHACLSERPRFEPPVDADFLNDMVNIRSLDIGEWRDVNDEEGLLYSIVHTRLTYFNMRGTFPLGPIRQHYYIPEDSRLLNSKHVFGFQRSLRQLQNARPNPRRKGD